MTFLSQVASALHYLHVHHIVHGDLRAKYVNVVAPDKVRELPCSYDDRHHLLIRINDLNTIVAPLWKLPFCYPLSALAIYRSIDRSISHLVDHFCSLEHFQGSLKLHLRTIAYGV